MYDPNRFIYIQIDNTKPQPHNRVQTPLFHLNVRRITDLTSEEIMHLMSQCRVAPQPCVKSQLWYIEADRKRRREYEIHKLQHDYWWEVCAKIQYKYTKEQLDKMPWTESRHKKHERVIGPTLWEWVEQCRPNSFHALWGRRKTLPGISRMRTKYTCGDKRTRRLSSRAGSRDKRGRRVQNVSPVTKSHAISSVGRRTTRSSRNVGKTTRRVARTGNNRRQFRS